MDDSSVTIFGSGQSSAMMSRDVSTTNVNKVEIYGSRDDSSPNVNKVENYGSLPITNQDCSPRKKRFVQERLRHLTWANYTTTMSCGGIALVLAETPHRFAALETLGTIVFIFDLVLFILITAAITSRFIIFPETLMQSLAHPTESLFFPTCWLSVATIISNLEQYGVPSSGPWLVVVVRILFWTYTAITFLVAVGQYHLLFTGKPLTLQSMTPAWILPVFPIMLSGTMASVISVSQPVEQALPILVAGLTFQGLGMMVSCFMYANYLGRLMRFGLPEPGKRPGMFIAVGPPSFTALALLRMSNDGPRVFASYGTIMGVSNPAIVPDVLHIVALTAAIFLWSLSFWFFCLSLVSVLAGMRFEWISFHLNWWSFVFPNVGFTIATIDIGKALNSEAIAWTGSVMTVLLVCMWVFVGSCHVYAFCHKKILWPGKDEDRDN